MATLRVMYLAANMYKRMHFGAGALSAEDLNQLVMNMDILEDTMVKGYYMVNEVSKNTGILIQGVVTGIVNPSSNTTRFANIYWSRPFSTGCNPVIVGTQYATDHAPLALSIRGIDHGLRPGNTGFRAEVNQIEDRHLWGNNRNWTKDPTLYSFIGLGW